MSKKKNDSNNTENKIPDNQPNGETETNEDISASQSEESAQVQEEKQSEVDELKASLAAEKDRYLRLAAEYDNFRKRSQKEREALFTDVRSDTILKLLPVYDNLERALMHDTSDEAFKKGVEMTMAQLKSIFEKMGITPIEAVGQPFDPTKHNAIMHVEDETKGENEIVEEFEKGFMLGEKVIRFSMVKVAN